MSGHYWLIFVLLNNAVWLLVSMLINDAWYGLAMKHSMEQRRSMLDHFATLDAMDKMSRCECGRRYDKCGECEATP